MGVPLSVLRGDRAPGAKWLPRDSLLAQSLTLYEGSLHDCGHPVWDTLNPDLEGRWVAPLPSRCHACDAIALKVTEYEKADRPQALMFRAEVRPDN